MRIALVVKARIPAVAYGGIARSVWSLGRALAGWGHEITFLAGNGSSCDFARVVPFTPDKDIVQQLPKDIDIVHLNCPWSGTIRQPYLVTCRGNAPPGKTFERNTVFISRNHAERHGGKVFVYNGMHWEDYGQPDWSMPREHLLFLAKAAWRVKNVKGALRIARLSRRPLAVAGGYRLNLNMGFRLTLDPNARFYGMVGGRTKIDLLNRSQALLFPVLWHEPFGNAIAEALYFGCPVFGTTFGSLPELVTSEVGFLSNSESELIRAIEGIDRFDRMACHEYAREHFSSVRAAEKYLSLYRQVMGGVPIHPEPIVVPDDAASRGFKMAA